MKRGMRQSLIVNNFFTLASIIIIAITITLYTKYIVNDDYENITKEKVIPLICEKDTFTRYKVYNQELLNESMKALDRGYYRLDGSYVKSQYLKSIIEDFISLDELNSFYIDSIQKASKKDINKFLTIKYEIIENDKKDPNKKSNCKICSGSVMTTFKADEKDIFKFYTDYKYYDKKEIASRIDCTIKVYRNHVKKIY